MRGTERISPKIIRPCLAFYTSVQHTNRHRYLPSRICILKIATIPFPAACIVEELRIEKAGTLMHTPTPMPWHHTPLLQKMRDALAVVVRAARGVGRGRGVDGGDEGRAAVAHLLGRRERGGRRAGGGHERVEVGCGRRGHGARAGGGGRSEAREDGGGAACERSRAGAGVGPAKPASLWSSRRNLCWLRVGANEGAENRAPWSLSAWPPRLDCGGVEGTNNVDKSLKTGMTTAFCTTRGLQAR